MNQETIQNIVDKHAKGWGGVIAILEEIQAKFGYLPEEALRIVAARLERPLTDLYGVATFYRAFSLKPRGKHLVQVCLGTACHVRNAPVILSEVERQLGIRAGQTTPDKEFSLETVNCLGACALGPIVVTDGHYFSKVDTPKVKKIVDQTAMGFEQIDISKDERVFPLVVNCARCNHSLMDPGHLIDGYPSIRLAISFKHEHGRLNLSALYGSYNVESEHEVPQDAVVNFFCPHCHAELVSASDCPECGTPMVPMFVRGGGLTQICPRRGCRGHLLDLSDTKIA